MKHKKQKQTPHTANLVSLNISTIMNHIQNTDTSYLEFLETYNYKHEIIVKALTNYIHQKLHLLSINTNTEHHEMIKQIFGDNKNCTKFLLIISLQHGIGGDESVFFLKDYLEMHNKAFTALLKHATIMNTQKKMQYEQIQEGKDYYFNITLEHINFDFLCAIILFIYDGPNIRVQRKPKNSTQMQTSTILLNVNLLNMNKTNAELKTELTNKKYIIWETFRASGAGGQHVNKTSSAVRLKHTLMPHVAIVSQQERNQVQNKKIALKKFEDNITDNIQQIIHSVLTNKFFNAARNQKNTTYNYRRNQITHDDGTQQNFELIKKNTYTIAILAHILQKHK